MHSVNRSRWIRAGSTGFLQSAGGLHFAGLPTLVASELVSRFVATFVLLRLLNIEAFKSIKSSLSLLKRYWGSLVWAYPAAVINALSVNVFPLLLTYMLGPEVFVSFFLVQRVVAIPLALISQSLSFAVCGSIVQILEVQEAERRKGLNKLLFAQLGLVFIGVAILYFIFEYFTDLVFGAGWKSLGSTFLICAPWFAAQFVDAPLSQVLNLTGHARAQLVWDIVRLIAIITAPIVLALAQQLLPLVSAPFIVIGYFSAVMTVMYAIHYVMIRGILA